jgi:hypothetical protein
MNDVRIKIAGFVFHVTSKNPKKSFLLEDIYKEFLTKEPAHVTTRGHYYKNPNITLRKDNRVFKSNIYWDVYRVEGRPVFSLRMSVSESDPYCISVFEPDFLNGDTYFLFRLSAKKGDDPLPNPLMFPLFHLLMISLLAQGHGVLVHACGIDDNGKGLLFTGSPSHGKTTIARLWRKDAVILNDERIVLRKSKGRLWIYGTPWHGDYEKASPRGVPLEKVYFLRRAETNRIKKLEGIEAVSMLLSHCFFPYWDAKGMQFVLNFCDKVAKKIPCYDLGFVRNKTVVEFIRSAK